MQSMSSMSNIAPLGIDEMSFPSETSLILIHHGENRGQHIRDWILLGATDRDHIYFKVESASLQDG